MAILLAAPTCYVTGLIFGNQQLIALAAVCGLVACVSYIALTLGSHGLHGLARSVDPPSGPDGLDRGTTVHYELHATQQWLAPVVSVEDTLWRNSKRGQRYLLGDLLSSPMAAFRYDNLPRGHYQLGPAVITRVSPLGLFTRKCFDNSSADFRIRPTISSTTQKSSGAINRHSWALSQDFSEIRPFAAGDDPRLIHWPSSAKRNQLMLRIFEPADEPALFIVLDCRSEAYLRSDSALLAQEQGGSGFGIDVSNRDFEIAVSAAASCLYDIHRRGLDLCLFLLSPSPSEIRICSTDPLASAMDLLAEVDLEPAAQGDTGDGFGNVDIMALAAAQRKSPSSRDMLIFSGPNANDLELFTEQHQRKFGTAQVIKSNHAAQSPLLASEPI